MDAQELQDTFKPHTHAKNPNQTSTPQQTKNPHANKKPMEICLQVIINCLVSPAFCFPKHCQCSGKRTKRGFSRTDQVLVGMEPALPHQSLLALPFCLEGWHSPGHGRAASRGPAVGLSSTLSHSHPALPKSCSGSVLSSLLPLSLRAALGLKAELARGCLSSQPQLGSAAPSVELPRWGTHS